jgi:hypothetical protein
MSKHISESRTETLVLELLDIQGWLLNRPPRGQVLRKNEYKTIPEISEIFKGKSKSGMGDAYPDFVIVEKNSLRPQMIIEAKADENDFSEAMKEASQDYGEACRQAHIPVIAVGVSGQEKTRIQCGALKYFNGKWTPITYAGRNISWIPTPEDISRLILTNYLLDLSPVVPRPEVLANRAT